MRHGVPIESPYPGILGTVNQNVAGVSGKGIRFQGYGHVSIPVSLNFALGKSASVSAWMKTEPGEINVPPILGAVGSDAAGEMLWGYVDETGKIAFDFASKKVTGPLINDGNWHHIAMTRNRTDGKIKLYVDGLIRDTDTDNIKYMERARVFRIGGSYVDELKVYNDVLSPEEIAVLANSSAPPVQGGSPQFAEAESLPIAAPQGITQLTHSSASGGSVVQSKTQSVGQWVEFTLDVDVAGEYELDVGVRKRFNCGIWQLSVDGVNLGSPVDLYNAGQHWTDINFGTKTLSAGAHVFRFQVTGKNGSASNYSGYFDTIVLTPPGAGN